MFILFVLGFLGSFLLGVSTLKSTSKEPAEQEVVQIRQMERTRLFQEAHGLLPWTYRRIGILCMAVFGGIALLGGFLVLFVFGWQAGDGWVMLGAGLVLLWLALFRLPQERKNLPTQSAQTLAHGMQAGEMTEGTPLE